MLNQLLSYGSQTIDKKDIAGVVKVLKSSHLTQGKKTPLFEKKISNYVNSKYAVAVNSGTSGLHISCLALGLSNKDIVWTVPNSWVASANCASLCGASVDFVDIDLDTLNISISKLESKLKKAKKNKLPKILIPVHFAGNPCNQEKLFRLSKKYKFKVIEDAAHALGSKNKGRMIGSCYFSDLTVFSFHPLKSITTGEGGMITTNNKTLYERLLLLRSHGLTKENKKLRIKKFHKWYYEQQSLGYNYRMSEIEAGLGLTQLNKIKKFLSKRNVLAKKYLFKLKDINLNFQRINRLSYCSFHLFIIMFPNKKRIINNYDKIFREFHKNKIAVMLHYFPIHLHPFYKKKGFKNGDFPMTENYAKRSFSIPIYPSMSFSQQSKVISIIKKVYKKFL